MQIDNHIFPSYQKGNVKLINADCMEIMAKYPDKYFDLLVADVPYGIKESLKKRENNITDKWKNPNKKEHNPKDWDKESPDVIYFNEAIRVSKNQIFWGANHFISKIPYNSSGWIVWDKKNGNSDFSDCELAFTSLPFGVRKFDWLWNGFQKQKPVKRIHPTEKPKELYEFCFLYAKSDKSFKVLDTHGGSFSSAIAAYYFGFSEFIGCEIDAEYFEKSIKRFEVETMQQVLSL